MKTVMIVKNKKKAGIVQYEKRLIEKLDELGIGYIRENENKDIDKSEIDAIIVLGGDGTILPLAGSEVPLLGINLGHIGYMSEIEKDELKLLDALAEDNFEVEERMMLDIYIDDGDGEEYFCSALNEAVLSKGAVSRMIDVEFTVCGRVISVYSADGLIVSTPTGSSAYSMAAGGPIIDPILELICLTPVSPHSLLKSRPLIFPPESKIEMRVLPTRDKRAYLSADGRKAREIRCGSVVRIRKSKKTTKLIKLSKYCFCDVLYRKLSK